MQVEVILLERVAKLGQIGDVVSVKSGYARNFLLPQNKALRATANNKKEFEGRKAEIEATNLETRKEAEGVIDKLQDLQVVLLRQASESGQLYGSVVAKDIAEAISAAGFNVARQQVRVQDRIKSLGILDITVQLHPEVACSVKLNIAKSHDEAELQWGRYERGEPVLMTAAEEEAIEERNAQEARMRRDQAKAEAAAAEAEAQVAAQAEGTEADAETSTEETPNAE